MLHDIRSSGMEGILVTREDVLNAYRFVLGREPENSEVITTHLNFPTVKALREHFMASEEFVSSTYGLLTVGRYAERTRQEIQIDCADEELDAMLQETSRTWSQFGEEAPHWSVLTSERYSPDNIDENIAQFYLSGVHDLQVALNALRRAGLKAEGFERALDFGCGVGRLSMPLSSIATQVTSVDVSPGHLKLARARAAETGVSNVDFVQLRDLRALDDFSGYDFILSLIVLQHNPPPVMAYAFRRLLRALRSGGVAVIQMPTFISEYFSVEHYLANPTGDMEMHALPQSAIFEIISQEGCRAVEVTEDASIGAMGLSHRFTIEKL